MEGTELIATFRRRVRWLKYGARIARDGARRRANDRRWRCIETHVTPRAVQMFWQAAKRLMANDDVQSELVDGGRLDDGSPRSPSRTMTF